MEEERRSRFRRICVFCGSSPGKKPSYQEAAVELGKELVIKKIAFFFFLLFFFQIHGDFIVEKFSTFSWYELIQSYSLLFRRIIIYLVSSRCL